MGTEGGQLGTVTAVAADHYTIKTEAGETFTIHFSVNTRIMRQAVRPRGARGEPGDGVELGSRGQGSPGGMGGNPPQTLKPSDIKVGDVITAFGELDAAAKSLGAVMILQVDPERARQLREARANYGKTWLMGKVTAMDGVKVTLLSSVDNATHAFVADENTTFRKRREPITLADIQVGDMVRIEGAVKDGSFVAETVFVMGMPPGGTPTVPRDGQHAPQPR